jgi:hypothetical protein
LDKLYNKIIIIKIMNHKIRFMNKLIRNKNKSKHNNNNNNNNINNNNNNNNNNN